VVVVAVCDGAKFAGDDLVANLVAKSWRAGLTATAVDGLPTINKASNVFLPTMQLQLSIRLPPGADGDVVNHKVKSVLEADPPFGAKVEYSNVDSASGWSQTSFSEKCRAAVEEATVAVFGQPTLQEGAGESIPLVNELQRLWPQADILVTGYAGPDSNPHGHDESLDLLYTAKFTAVFCEDRFKTRSLNVQFSLFELKNFETHKITQIFSKIERNFTQLK
jgi:acetylornithine deacetylase/succinyl-diaminopimelate desuccinylase-like protein